MHDLSVVGMRETRKDLLTDVEAAVHFDRSAIKDVANGFARDVFHDDVRIGCKTKVRHRNAVRVIETTHGLGFSFEAQATLGVGR